MGVAEAVAVPQDHLVQVHQVPQDHLPPHQVGIIHHQDHKHM